MFYIGALKTWTECITIQTAHILTVTMSWRLGVRHIAPSGRACTAVRVTLLCTRPLRPAHAYTAQAERHGQLHAHTPKQEVFVHPKRVIYIKLGRMTMRLGPR